MANVVSDKEIKKQFKLEASKSPEKYYAVSVLEEMGYSRKQCPSCSKFFWATSREQKVCGDAICNQGVSVFKNNPAKVKLSFREVWETFKEHFSKRGYTPINRYPVVSRWNPTTDFTMASIAAFQPHVVSGEIDPPAKKLVIPQFCLRFGDIDNVGITGSHCTGFIMIGQHMFVQKSEWNQAQAFRNLFEYITDVVGLPKSEITLHEDAWAGGGNFGPCMEFFSRGIELCNQVYMLFEQTPDTEDGRRELKINVLDMGLGMERIAWFSQATPTIYEATFPKVIEELKAVAQVDYDTDLFMRFAPYSSLLNLDEVENLDEAWDFVAKKTGIPAERLKEKILPMTGIYSIAEHSRSLLFAMADGALPSNVGGYYNLRVILRRALSFIDRFSWDIDLYQVCVWHALELEPLFPELKESLGDVKKILAYEKKRYEETKTRGTALIEQAIEKGLTTEKLLELYDSHGINPELVKEVAMKKGKKTETPENFYALLAERHEKQEQKTQTKKAAEIHELLEAFGSLQETEILYYDHYDLLDFEAKVAADPVLIESVPKDHPHYHHWGIVLDRTAFYPTSGGQVHDVGSLSLKQSKQARQASQTKHAEAEKNEKYEVVDVFKLANKIVHVLSSPKGEMPGLRKGDGVRGTIELERRIQLAQHHTATHILNGACRKVLGNHIWQAGAAKTLEKSRLDITHYENLTEEEIRQIEQVANKVVRENLPVYKTMLPKNIAEAKYGFRLYQGGAVPGKKIRVVEILNFDTEACGGTHLDLTGDVGEIKILRSSKLQDGIIRLEFVAGKALDRTKSVKQETLSGAAEILGCKPSQVPGRAQELFDIWKAVVKKGKKQELLLKSQAIAEGDPLAEASKMLKVQPENLTRTLLRFKSDIENALKK